MAELSGVPGVRSIQPAGPFRHRRETIGDQNETINKEPGSCIPEEGAQEPGTSSFWTGQHHSIRPTFTESSFNRLKGIGRFPSYRLP
jgi:hypothetical protein